MKTLYLDVYFLINFTVDVLALYFSALLSKITVTNKRLIISGILGALCAIINTLMFSNAIFITLVSIIFFILMISIATGKIGCYRKIKYGIAFLIFQILIGGIVYYAYCLLDELFKDYNIKEAGAENRRLIVLAVVILLSLGVFKVLVAFFGNFRSETKACLTVEFMGVSETFDALVDSGNLAQDPFDRTPVMIVNEGLGKKLFGEDLCYVDVRNLKNESKKCIRIIPVEFGGEKRILYGMKPDKVTVTKDERKEKVSLIIAVDKSIKNYGGYPALVPLSALEDIFYDI